MRNGGRVGASTRASDGGTSPTAVIRRGSATPPSLDQAVTTATSASTTSGSNCVPAFLRSSPTAISRLSALR